jgi:hypothetical protein
VTISFSSLTRANEPAVQALLLPRWLQDGKGNDKFARELFVWRYEARPFGETLLAFDDGRCVANLDSLLRPYLLSGVPVTVRETCDWFCLPEYRPLGIGIKLIRQMMTWPEPILVIGGNAPTRELLPRMKWSRFPEVSDYLLPLSWRALGALALRRFLPRGEVLARLIPSQLALRRPRQLPRPPSYAQVRASPGTEIPPPPPRDTYGLASLIDETCLEWLAHAPREIGDLVSLNFWVEDAPVGISIIRLVPQSEGLTAKIVHLQCALHSPAMMEWIVSETSRYLMTRGAGLITGRFSCPTIGAALQRVGFLCVRKQPAFWWSREEIAPPHGPMHLTMLRGDDALGEF